MRPTFKSMVWLALAGCGIPELLVPDPPPPPEKPFVAPAYPSTAPAEAAPTAPKGSAKLVAASGSFQLTATLDKRTFQCQMGVEQVSLRVGDLPTLEHVVGHIKLNPTDLACGDPSDDTLVHAFLDRVLMVLDAPIQIFFDVGSVTHMVGGLAQDGDKASGLVLGELQVDDHKADLDVAAGFERTSGGGVTVTIPQFELDLDPYELAPRFAKLAAQLKGRAFSTKLSVEGQLVLSAFEGETLPSFIRVPVTVNRASAFERRLEAEIPDDVIARQRLMRLGFPTELVDKVKARQAAHVKELRTYYNRANDVDFDAQARRSGTQTVNHD